MSAAPVSIRRAMLLAAGLGLRMRPITETIPKPLVPLAGRPLLDHALDRLEEVGVERAVVNTHYLGEQIAAHLAGRARPQVVLSPEVARLETGGGVLRALPHFEGEPFFVVNGDVFWLNGPRPALEMLAAAWGLCQADALLLLHPTIEAFGYRGDGDFMMDPLGRLSRRPERQLAPYLFTGIQILHPRLFRGAPEGGFSLNVLYDRAIEAGRLYGVLHDGKWFHLGTPRDLALAEVYLAGQHSGVRRR